MATIVVTERIRGQIVCTTTQRRDQVLTAAANWARKVGSDMPQAEGIPQGKYGGPAAIIAVDFPDRASADAAWADIDGLNPNFVIAGSEVMQYTATEDGVSINTNVVHHRIIWDPTKRVVV